MRATNCIGTPCGTPDPVGACCEGNFCWVGTESTCSGEWLGANTNCVSSPCASGPAFLIVPLDYPTIQAAIDASSNGDTVLVVAGTYTGSGSEVIKTRGRGITIRSLAGAAVTTIDGEGLRHVVSCTNNESSTTIIEGFTITGGAGNWGGGIFCGGSSPSFTDCIITDNTATTRGGGAYTIPVFTHIHGLRVVLQHIRVWRSHLQFQCKPHNCRWRIQEQYGVGFWWGIARVFRRHNAYRRLAVPQPAIAYQRAVGRWWR